MHGHAVCNVVGLANVHVTNVNLILVRVRSSVGILLDASCVGHGRVSGSVSRASHARHVVTIVRLSRSRESLKESVSYTHLTLPTKRIG